MKSMKTWETAAQAHQAAAVQARRAAAVQVVEHVLAVEGVVRAAA